MAGVSWCRLIIANPILAVETVPAGPWAVGVSGGADSVALLELLRSRNDLSLHVVHLNHQTRGDASDGDADFVAQISARWELPITTARLTDIENEDVHRETNKSARFRAARFALFHQVVQSHQLRGVILAHHADDQAETILQRLLRGSSAAGLGGMSASATIDGLTVLRPLLGVSKEALRVVLVDRGIAWREDASNSLLNQQRNRVRQLLEKRPRLTPLLLDLAASCRAMTTWLHEHSPTMPESFEAAALRDLPLPVARESARRWLADRAGGRVEIPPAAMDRLLEMASDAASPPRQHFPAKIMVRRKAGTISATAASAPSSSVPSPAPVAGESR